MGVFFFIAITVAQFQQRPHNLQRLKYSLSDPLQRKFFNLDLNYEKKEN